MPSAAASPCCASLQPRAPAPAAHAGSRPGGVPARRAPAGCRALRRGDRRAPRGSRGSNRRRSYPSARSPSLRFRTRDGCPRRRYIVNTMIRAEGSICRMRRIASGPLVTGSCRSISVTSGRLARNCVTACSPLLASATTSMSGCTPTIFATVCAVPGSSPAKCANLRDHAAGRLEDASHEL